MSVDNPPLHCPQAHKHMLVFIHIQESFGFVTGIRKRSMLEDRQEGKGITSFVRLVDIWGKEGFSEWL